jgi:hypothetical protein
MESVIGFFEYLINLSQCLISTAAHVGIGNNLDALKLNLLNSDDFVENCSKYYSDAYYTINEAFSSEKEAA